MRTQRYRDKILDDLGELTATLDCCLLHTPTETNAADRGRLEDIERRIERLRAKLGDAE